MIKKKTPVQNDEHQKWVELIALTIKEFRLSKGLYQDEVEGLTRREVQRSEDINGNMTLKKFFRVCQHLECHPLEVFEILR